MAKKHFEKIRSGYASFTKGSEYFFTTDAIRGTSISAKATGKINDEEEAKPSAELVDPERASNRYYVPWYDDNQYPHKMLEKMGAIGIGKRSLTANADMHFGSGVVWVRDEFTENGKIVKVPVRIPDWERMVRHHDALLELSDCVENLEGLYISWVQLIFNKAKTRVNRFKTLKSVYCRYTPMDDRGKFKSIIYSAAFPDDPRKGEYEELQIIDRKDLFKYAAPVVVITYGSLDKLYYPKQDFAAVYENGWSDVAAAVPKQISAIYKNAINIKWHIKIPMAFFTNKYKDWSEKPEAEQIKLFEAERDEMEKWLVGSENAHKAFISLTGGTDDNLGNGGDWVFEPMKDYLESSKELPNAVAANSEILYAMSLDPEILGLGVPGTSNLSGSGSGKRNATQIKQASLTRERLVSLQLLNLIAIINGYPEDVYPQFLSQDTSQTMDQNPTGSQTVIQ